MRIRIDLALCQGHGVCQDEAPEVFRVVENAEGYDHVELVVADPDESLRPKVERAVRFCLNRTLSLEG
ncbi:MAG: ferredoxin [Myxococcota bacterium]